MYGDIGFWTHIHTGAALAVEIVQALETSLQDKSLDSSYNTLLLRSTLQHVQSGCSSHLHDCSSMHLLTMEAHTASLQPDTEAAIMLVASARLVTAAAATTASLATDPSTAPPSPRPLVICKETVVNRVPQF